MNDEEVILPEPKPPCQGGCPALIADLQAAVAGVAQELNKLTEDVVTIVASVNSIGDLSTTHQETLAQILQSVGQFQHMAASMGPAQMLKGLMGRR